MSRNPYLSSHSSYTRPSRSSNLTSYLNRSRSSANLSAGSLYSRPSSLSRSYVPSTSSNSWQSSARTSALNSRYATKSTSDIAPTRSGLTRSPTTSHVYERSKQQQQQSSSDDDDSDQSNQLQNYQQRKSQNPQPTSSVSSSLSFQEAKTFGRQAVTTGSCVELNSASAGQLPAGGQAISSSSDTGSRSSYNSELASKHRASGHLLKSQSLDISKAPAKSSDATLNADISMSLDRLLAATETMTDRQVRKCYRELVVEHDKLKKQLSDSEEEWVKKERQFKRKISELEQLNKLMEQCKQEIQRLKEENSSLIRVVSKLSKHN